MKTEVESVVLKSGESMDISHVIAPEGDHGLDLVAFLHERGPFQSGSRWHRYLHRAWSGDLSDEVTVCFTVGERDGDVVGVVGYSTPAATRDVCTWGHVVTRADQTGKGIATELTRESIAHFRALSPEPARAMYLSTGSDGAPRRVYEKCGMIPYGIVGTSAAMWLPMGDPEAFEDDYYGNPGRLSTRGLTIADMPRLEALMSLPRWTVKMWADGCTGPRAYEGQFHGLWDRTQAGMPCRVLRGSTERVYAVACVSQKEGDRILDVVAHPSVEDEAGDLLRDMARAGDLRAYTAGPDELRSRLLAAAGFTRAGQLDEPLDLGDRKEEVTVWVKS